MNQKILFSSFAAALIFTACGSDEKPVVDAGVPDMGTIMPTDAGVRAVCPVAENNPSCMASSDCIEVSNPPSNCGPFCPGYFNKSCITGQCVTPEEILADEPINLNVDVGALFGQVRFFVNLVLVAESAGGEALSCDTVKQNGWDYRNSCYNITDVRARKAGNPFDGSRYLLPLSGVPASRKVIFVVYGFEEEDTSKGPIGISCTEHDVPAPGAGNSMRQIVPADKMSVISG